MANAANVVFVLGFVQNEQALSKNKVLMDRYGEKRAFYSCNKTDIDYLKYVDTGSKEPVDYVEYSGDNEKSLGAFNKDGLMSRSDKTQLRKALRETKSIIWHGIISFEEVFGKRYMADYEQAYRLMKTEFPRFLKNAGFNPDKIEWFAGLHENTKYRHIHYSFFEREPSRLTSRKKGLNFSKGQISNRLLEQFKVKAEQRLTDISSEIKIARKGITDLSKNLLFSPESKIRYQSEIQELLDRLLNMLPADGRLSYDSENMRDLKPQVNKIIDSLFKLNKPLYEKLAGFCGRVKQRDSDTLAMLKRSKISECEWGEYLVADKYLTDLYRRLGNQVINSVRTAKGRERKIKNRLANKRMQRKTLKHLITSIIQLNADFEREAAFAFEEFLKKLDEEKGKNQEDIHSYEME